MKHVPVFFLSIAFSACGGTRSANDRDADAGAGSVGEVSDATTSGDTPPADDTSGPNATSTASVDACNALYAALLQRYSDCDGRPLEYGLAREGQGGNPTQSDLRYVCSRVGVDVASGTIAFDGSALSPCEDDLRAITCNALLPPFGGAVRIPSSCDAIFTGSVALGGPCALNEDCQTVDPDAAFPGYERCDTSPGCPGECAPALYAVALCGSPPPGAPCTVEETCDRPTGRCVARKTAGSCSTPDDCAGGYRCVPQGQSGAGVCTAFQRAGDPCTAGDCAPGFSCSAGVCAPWPHAGGPCGKLQGEQVSCLDGICSAPLGGGGYTGQGICAARLSVGASCDAATAPVQGNPCVAGSACTMGQCVARACL